MGLWGKKETQEEYHARFLAQRSAELGRAAAKGTAGDDAGAAILLVAAGRAIGAQFLRQRTTVAFDPPTPVAIRQVYEWLIAVGYVAGRRDLICDVAILGPEETKPETECR
jgi:hypothetical protein